ncbi:MFS general substrate transporter [Cerioporus squamosus]|nr:MFS general substrate transporter [Cerioporus squamosus]
MSDAPLLEDEVTTEAVTAARQETYEANADNTPVEEPSKSRWLKASPIWMLALVAIAAISTSGTVAPRASAAQLMAVISALSGLLSTVSAAWWGSLSDCYGRMWVLSFNVGGLMLSDMTFLTVAHYWETLPGTYWWFALGPIIEGAVGGISVASIIMHAYISDCSDPTARSRAFSQLMGLLFVGMSVGPLLSGYIMRTTSQLLPVFYATAAIDTTVTLAVWFIMPESLPRAEMQKHRAARDRRRATMGTGLAGWLKRVGSTFDVVSPLSILLPRKVEHAGNKTSVDWNMTILGAAYGFGTFIQESGKAAIYQQIQYASSFFEWTSDIVSYWLGIMHIAKAVYLTLLFPGLVRILVFVWARRRRSQAGESQPLMADDPTTPSNKVAPTAALDLWLARAAVLLDIFFYAMAFKTKSGVLFALYTSCIAFGTHFGPTVQSLALDLYTRHGETDTGRLLGALTVISALSSHIIGPALFGFIYMKTVATVPGAFYLLQCAALSRSRSRPGSRPRSSRHSTASSIQYSHDPEDFINPGAATISEEDNELLQELVHPHHLAEETLIEDVDDAAEGEEEEFDEEWRSKLPWWRRPSPWWFLAYVPFAAIALSITAAAKIELFTYLVCHAQKPEYNHDQGGGMGDMLSAVGEHVCSVPPSDVATFLKLALEPDQRVCQQDPVVQAAVAKLTVIMTTTMGILACMTTAWWGSLSDRYGRTKVLSCAVIGVLIMDMNFLCVFWFYNYIPGGYWFLVSGPVLEGLLGGQALISATIHAYIADCTPPALRSGIFSLHLGLLFTGMGIGPTLGGLIIRFTGEFIYVFYISAAIHCVYALLVWFIIPESLSRTEMIRARQRHKEADDEYRSANAHGGFLVFLKRVFAFLTPLSLFLPIDLNGGNPAKGKRRDWSLLFLVAAFGLTVSLLGLYLYIIQYLSGVYGWNTEQVGYWFSSLGVARAVFLTLILPCKLTVVKPYATRSPSTVPTRPRIARSPSVGPNAPHSPKFDLVLARVSLGIEVVVYALMICSTSGLMFAAITALGALGMGFSPAVQSIALTLYNRRGGKDTGKLFGAMSVVNALSAQVFGPFVYGLTYARTVGTFPKMIFVMACCSVTIAFTLMLFVRIPTEEDASGLAQDIEEQPGTGDSGPRIEREDTLVDPPEPLIIVDDEDRGRKVIKP